CFEPLLFGKNDAEPVQDPSDWGAVFDGLVGELEARGDTVAAVVVEPILQGAAGMRLYPAEQLQRLRRACDAAGCLLIADEVFTGFGRTGRMWACEHAGVVPDLLCTSKALSGGLLPFAATLATGAVYDRFRGDATRALLHGHTFFGNPLGAAVAREVLAVYREEEILAKAQAKASRVAACFQRLGELPGARRARWLGMMGAVDLGDEGYFGTKGWEVWREAKRRGVSLRPLGDTVYVTPPLNLEDGMLEELLGVVEGSVGAVLAAG
ncbi:MAG TPA: aminotransferase class III-fold pyridoxal phosphate-dependent enzyme, partial [Polyangiaceae bacterium LLY-WYZ-15_(1-7)]|nr:aminotransferase class III-fold pyridoxal phosphate-dependent enzyme [Polyangiaceae bacterium LLY-WYZ-15_(1-7)]